MSWLTQVRLNWLEKFVNLLDRIAIRRRPEASHLVTGRRGERAALYYLQRNGFIVTARGWRSSKARGDLDLVAWEKDVLCFIEVKTRTTRAVAPAEAAVDADKKRMLRKMAHYYLRQLSEKNVAIRFDILSIYFEKERLPEFTLFRGAFGWE